MTVTLFQVAVSITRNLWSMSQRARTYIFTINNPDGDINVDIEHAIATGQVRYCVYQLEQGDNGTPHYQGYIEFTESTRFNSAKELLGGRAHLEPRRGTRDQARSYCTKEDTRIDGPFELGEWKQERGRRNDLIAFRDDIISGKSERHLFTEHTSSWFRYNKALDRARLLFGKKRDEPTEVWVLLGPTGCGKTEYALRNFTSAYWKPPGKWWDGHNPDEEETVICDEYYGWFQFGELLRMGDKTPLLVETKGGHIHFRAKRLVLISNRAPIQWYPNVHRSNSHNFEALYRRFTKVLIWLNGEMVETTGAYFRENPTFTVDLDLNVDPTAPMEIIRPPLSDFEFE